MNLPVFLGTIALLSVGAAGLMMAKGSVGQSVGSGLFAAAILALALADLRRIDVDGDELRVRTPYGARSLPLAELALAIAVTRSRGNSTYTVYGLAADGRVDLAEAGSRRRAERFVERLTETFLRGRAPSEASERNRLEAERREASWRDAESQAAAYVAAAWRGSRAAIWIAVILLLVSVGTSLAMAYFKGVL